MVLCFFALPVLMILGIFSAAHRKLAWDAIQCVFLKVTLKPCHTGLDTKIKAAIVGGIFRRHKGLGRFTYKYFTLLSWIFVILLLGSTYYTIYGGINYYKYGNCNGQQSDSFCIFDITGKNSELSGIESESCGITPPIPSSLTLDEFDVSLFPRIERDGAQHEVVIIGCYGCEFTRKTYPVIKEIIEHENVNVTFAHLPLKPGREIASLYGSCIWDEDQDLFWEFSDMVFNLPIDEAHDEGNYDAFLLEKGLDLEKVFSCVNANSTREKVSNSVQNIAATNVYGTPTIFIDGEPIVGPKPRRVYMRLLR